MKHIAAILLALLLAAASLAGVAGAAEVAAFAAQASVGSDKVTLADLLRPGQGPSPALEDALGQVVVMKSPRLGRTAKVNGSRVRALMDQARVPAGTSVLIPQEIEVSRTSQRVGAGQLARAYREALERRLAQHAGRSEVHSIRARDQVVPGGKLEFRVHFLGNDLSGMVAARVEIVVDGRVESRERVTGRVDLYGPAVVAARSLPRRHMLEPGDLKVVEVRLNDVTGPVATEPDELAGLRTRQAVTMGQPILLSRVERAPIIKRGEVVRMICVSGSLQVSAKGRAEATGYKDGSIKLTNLVSGREVYGRVLDAGTVLVRF